MNIYNIKRFGLINAIIAEIEAAKLDNKIREENGTGFSIGFNYPTEFFNEKAEQLRNLSYCHDEKL